MAQLSVFYRRNGSNRDQSIITIMEAFAGKWWASGMEIDTRIRDMAFDLPDDRIDEAKAAIKAVDGFALSRADVI